MQKQKTKNKQLKSFKPLEELTKFYPMRSSVKLLTMICTLETLVLNINTVIPGPAATFGNNFAKKDCANSKHGKTAPGVNSTMP